MVTTEQKNKLLDLMRLATDGDQASYHQFLLQISKIIRVIVKKEYLHQKLKMLFKKC